MGWLYVLGIITLAVVFLVMLSLGRGDVAPDDDDSEGPKDYRWGDELHEYSYRHPWDDEL